MISKTDRRRYPYFAEAADYFYFSYMENDNKFKAVYREIYRTTRQGEQKYLQIQSVMWDYEEGNQWKHYKKEMNRAIKKIIANDVNWQ